MASRPKKASKAVPFSSADLHKITKANPYIQRLIEDADLRDNLTTVVDSGKSAYGRLVSSKAPHKAVLEDKKLHKDVQSAGSAVKDVATAFAATPKKKAKKAKKRGRKLLLLLVAAGLALALSESLRSKVLDALFGAEEEFQYTPPTPTPTTPPASPVSAA